jgi:hypothetical protein
MGMAINLSVAIGALAAIIFGIASEKIIMKNAMISVEMGKIYSECNWYNNAVTIMVDIVVNIVLKRLLANRLNRSTLLRSDFNLYAYRAHKCPDCKLKSRCSEIATVAVSRAEKRLAIKSIIMRLKR